MDLNQATRFRELSCLLQQRPIDQQRNATRTRTGWIEWDEMRIRKRGSRSSLATKIFTFHFLRSCPQPDEGRIKQQQTEKVQKKKTQFESYETTWAVIFVLFWVKGSFARRERTFQKNVLRIMGAIWKWWAGTGWDDCITISYQWGVIVWYVAALG